MNRHEFEKAVDGSGLDLYSNLLLRYYASKKHWNEDGKVWVSAATTVRETGLSLSTVNRRVPILREQGWLVDTGERVGNGAIKYDLAIGTPVTETEVTKTVQQDPCQTDSGTPVTETRTPVSQTRTPVTETDKEEKNKKEEVIEEVTVSPTAIAAVESPTSPNNRVKEEPMKYLRLLNPKERQDLEQVGGLYETTPEQLEEAAFLLKTNKVLGYDFTEKRNNALRKVGVEVDEW